MSSLLTFGETWVPSPETFYYSLIPALTKIITLNKWLVLIIVLFYLHSSVWFTNPVGTNLVMFNLYLKKNNLGKLTRYDHALLAIFLNFAGFIFIAYVGRKKKMRWPLGGNFELPIWFITVFNRNTHFKLYF
jgi:hypothetical protein